jgi:hypothetical protein
LVSACASALTALVVGGGALASASSSGGGQTFTVIEKSTGGKFVDLGKKGFGVGDEFTFASDFWNTAQTRKVGHSTGTASSSARRATIASRPPASTAERLRPQEATSPRRRTSAWR